jgi:hypothetical protein
MPVVAIVVVVVVVGERAALDVMIFLGVQAGEW